MTKDDLIAFSGDPLSLIAKDIENLIFQNGSLARELDSTRSELKDQQRRMLLGVIEVVDSFENVFKIIESRLKEMDKSEKAWLSNFRTIYRLLVRLLEKNGVVQIQSEPGERIDPYLHYVVEVEPRSGADDETIIEVLKKGYLLEGQLLRECQVSAVKNS